MRQFEDDVVRWLLEHYQLLNTRTRWMLLDLEEQLFKYELRDRPTLLDDDGPPARRLTFRAFQEFFPDFPVRLESAFLRAEDCERLVFPKPLASFEKTRLGRDFHKMRNQHDQFAIFFRWPYQKHFLAMHNCLPLNTDLTGPHCCWRLADGGVAAIQELPSFAATVDGQTPPNDWMRSAISPRHAQTVCPAERAT